MEFLKEWLLWIVYKLQSLAFEAGSTLIAVVMDSLPVNEGPAWYETWGNFYSVVNSWVPIEEAVGIFSLMLAWRLSLVAIKWVLKFIPTIG